MCVQLILQRHATSMGTARTFPKLSAGLQCSVNRHSRVEHSSSLPEAPLPGHMVGQLAQAVGHTAQVYPAIPLPSPPCNSPIITPRPQGIRMCLRCTAQRVSSMRLGLTHSSGCQHGLAGQLAIVCLQRTKQVLALQKQMILAFTYSAHRR